MFIKESSLKSKIYNHATPEVWHNDWFTLEEERCLMICHDQIIDRRIMQQAISLDKIKVKTLIVCLSHEQEDKLEINNGIFIHRIGLKKITPDCPIYWRYQRINLGISSIQYISSKFYTVLHKLNFLFYHISCKLLYCCKTIHYPLPFDECFYRAGYLYKANIVVAHDLPALKAARRIAFRRKIPFIYDAHELYSEQKVFSSYQKKLLNKIESENITQCDKVFIVCEPLAKIMEERYKIIKPSVILNVVPYYAVHYSEGISDLINIPKGDNIFILFQGGVLKNRNIENLVKGFLLLHHTNVKLIFLGPRDEEFTNDLKKIIREELNKKVFFLNPVTQDKLLGLTSGATLGIIPYIPHDLNTKYCLSNKLFEFIQAEVPFVYHQGLLEIRRIANQLNMAALAIDFSTPRRVGKGLEKVLKLDLAIYKKILKEQKHQFCWENEEKQYLESVQKLLLLDDISNLAKVSNYTPLIEGFEFQKIFTENLKNFYTTAYSSDNFPHYIVLDFSTPVRLVKIKIVWESVYNYGSKYSLEYFDKTQNKFIELVKSKNVIGKNHFLSVKNEIYYTKIRLVVYETVGQKRLIIRDIQLFGNTINIEICK